MRDSDPLPSHNYIQVQRVDWLRNISDVCFCLLLMLSLLESGQHDTFPLCGAGVTNILQPVSVSLGLGALSRGSGEPWYDSILTFTMICLLYCQLKTWTNRNTRNKQKASSLVPAVVIADNFWCDVTSDPQHWMFLNLLFILRNTFYNQPVELQTI